MTVLGESGRIYRYLHMDMPGVHALFPHPRLTHGHARPASGPEVSNDFGGSATTIHMHFEIKAPVTEGGPATVTIVPTYSSLVDSYGRLLNDTA